MAVSLMGSQAAVFFGEPDATAGDTLHRSDVNAVGPYHLHARFDVQVSLLSSSREVGDFALRLGRVQHRGDQQYRDGVSPVVPGVETVKTERERHDDKDDAHQAIDC